MDAQNQEKEMLTCPACGKQFYKNVDGSDIGFCPFCGTKMSFDVGATFVVMDESKGNDRSNETEESNDKIVLTETSESKDIIQLTETSEPKDNIELMETSESKGNPELKETDESKKDNEIQDTDELKDNNESIVSGELKESVELKEVGELKADYGQTAINEPQESIKVNETAGLKEIDVFKSDQTEIKDENITQPVLQPVFGFNPEQDKAVNENLNPGSENTNPAIEELKQDADNTKAEPEKDGKPYDVILGIILFAIGIILIFVYVVFTPNGIIDENNKEAVRVQTEQMAEQNPGR
jgi:hypothetical protein